MEILQSMFLENWAKPILEWCRSNNLIFTGHVLHEDSLTNQAVPHGSLMRFYEYLDYPGVDVLTEGNRNYWIVKQLSSAARQRAFSPGSFGEKLTNEPEWPGNEAT
jgi:hypothetical protein